MRLSNNTKELMQRAMDFNPSLTPIMHQISHYRYRDEILKWLINNNIVGKNLLSWLKENHDNSVMGMVKFIVKYKNKEAENREIKLNRDWIK